MTDLSLYCVVSFMLYMHIQLHIQYTPSMHFTCTYIIHTIYIQRSAYIILVYTYVYNRHLYSIYNTQLYTIDYTLYLIHYTIHYTLHTYMLYNIHAYIYTILYYAPLLHYIDVVARRRLRASKAQIVEMTRAACQKRTGRERGRGGLYIYTHSNLIISCIYTST